MDLDRFEEIEQRLANASPGPWEWREGEPGSLIITPEGNYHPTNILKCTDDWRPYPNDAEFIAHARQDIEDLVAHVIRLERQVVVTNKVNEILIDKVKEYKNDS